MLLALATSRRCVPRSSTTRSVSMPLVGIVMTSGLRMAVGADHKVVQIRAQKGFAAGEGHVERCPAEMGKEPAPIPRR
jgi:hypothetical protein